MARIVLYDWMIRDLKLQRTSLLVFGLIYECTQGGGGFWHGGLDRLALRSYSTEKTVTNAINKLEKLGYIERFKIKIDGENKVGMRSLIDWDEMRSKIYEINGGKEYNLERYKFVSQFLDPNRKRTTKQVYSFINRYIIKRKPVPDGIVEYIVDMPYNKFLRTLYWQAVSTYVKDRAGNQCQVCGEVTILEAHHNTYEHHGDEIHNLSDLICVCRTCHRKIHKK